MEGRNQNWKKLGSSTCKTNLVPLWLIPFLPKFGALGVQASRLSHERGGLHRAVWKAIGSIHYPIDLFTRRYIATTIDSVTRTLESAPLAVDVARAFLLMSIGLRSTWVGKGSPFCLAWSCEWGSGCNFFY